MELVALVAADRNGLTSKLEDALATVLRIFFLYCFFLLHYLHCSLVNYDDECLSLIIMRESTIINKRGRDRYAPKTTLIS